LILPSVTTESWEPDFLDNLALPASERIRIKIKYPTIEEREKLSEIKFEGAEKFTFKSDVKNILTNHVKSIENLYDDVDGKQVAIKDGAALLKSTNKHLPPLIQKITARVLNADAITEDDEKNSEGPAG
jgi:hypothetical protein